MYRDAVISNCGNYRYTLTRRWQDAGIIKTVAFIMLNPSTADADVDDPTIRRCIGFAQRWGYGRLLVGNLFAFRTTDPNNLMHIGLDAIGVQNNHYLRHIVKESDLVVAAWGAYTIIYGRENFARQLIGDKLHYLRLTKAGHPSHPLYLPKALDPVRWNQ